MTQTQPAEEPGRRTGVVERLTQILDVFAVGPDAMTLEEITALGGLPRSTTFRLLRQLVEMRWLEHDERGYQLGQRIRHLGQRVESHARLRAAAAATIEQLQRATAGVVHLVILDGDSIEMLDKLGGTTAPTIPTNVGVRFRAEDSVAGRAMLSALAPERVDRLIESRGAVSDTSTLHRRLSTIRHRRGLAVTTDDMPWDLRGIGAPILGSSGPVAAISVGLPGRSANVERFAPLITRAAASISRQYSAAHRAAAQ
ncbi:IclR family transcriptional regulator [Nocardioides dubius]|uniref:IclR family transcriptional regulator n=1 Tax=Nocardioides dubius TaxID=317019 RepID=A0ABN1U093_9ACTN